VIGILRSSLILFSGTPSLLPRTTSGEKYIDVAPLVLRSNSQKKGHANLINEDVFWFFL
jgi:hypothetical protein